MKQLFPTGTYLQFALLTFLKYKFLHNCQTLGEGKAIEWFDMNGLEPEIIERLELTLSIMTASKDTAKQTSKFPLLKKQIHICELIFKLLLILPMRSSDEAKEYFNTMLKYSATCHADLAVWYSVSKMLHKNSQQRDHQAQQQLSETTISCSTLFQTLKKKLESFNLIQCLKYVRAKLFSNQDDIKKELVVRWICACAILHTLSTEQAQQQHQQKSLYSTEMTSYYFSNVIGKGQNVFILDNCLCKTYKFHFLMNGMLNALRRYQITQFNRRESKFELEGRSLFFSNIDK